MADQITGIVGNTQSQQDRATSSREEQKQANWSLGFKIGIGATLLAFAVVLSTAELSLFWKLVTAAVLFQLGKVLAGKESRLLWVWPQILKYAGIATFLVAILGSGIGAWTESIVQSVDMAALCSADPSQDKCIKKRQEDEVKAAAKKKHPAVYSSARPVVAQQPFVIGNCTGEFVTLKGCERVTFGDTSFIRPAKKGLCLAYNPVEAVQKTDLGGSQYEFKARRGVTIHFFDLQIGEKHGNFNCG